MGKKNKPEPKGTNGKANGSSPKHEEPVVEEKVEDPVVEDSPDPSEPEAKSKKDKKNTKQDLKKQRKREEYEMLRAGRGGPISRMLGPLGQRVFERVLNMTGVTPIMALIFGDGSVPLEENKSARNQAKKSKPIGEQINDAISWSMKNKQFIASISFMILLFAMRLDGGFVPGDGDRNPYDVLGVSRSAAQADIKASYKKLSLEWHPDKHPDCEECPDKFAEISKAYEKVGTPGKRREFDAGKSSKGDDFMKDANSVKITIDFFEREIRRGTNVWQVLAYDPSDTDPLYNFFSTLSSNPFFSSLVKFGHIDGQSPEGAEVIRRLGLGKIAVFPVVIRIAPGEFPLIGTDLRPKFGEQDVSPTKLANFIAESYPDKLKRVTEPSEAMSILNDTNKRQFLFVTGAGKIPKALHRDGKAKRWEKREPLLMLKKLALQFYKYFDFVVIEQELFAQEEELNKTPLYRELVAKGFNKMMGVMGKMLNGYNDEILGVEDLDKAFPELFRRHALLNLETTTAVYADQVNWDSLCKGGEHDDVRRFCLVLPNYADSDVEGVLSTLLVGRKELEKQTEKPTGHFTEGWKPGMQDDLEEDEKDQGVSVQVVRVKTGGVLEYIGMSSVVPTQMGFASLAGDKTDSDYPAFIVSGDLSQVIPCNTEDKGFLEGLYTGLYYEDIVFKADLKVVDYLGDPMMPWSQELYNLFFGSLIMCIISYLLIVIVVAFLMEVPEWKKASVYGVIVIGVVSFFCSLNLRRELFGPIFGGDPPVVTSAAA